MRTRATFLTAIAAITLAAVLIVTSLPKTSYAGITLLQTKTGSKTSGTGTTFTVSMATTATTDLVVCVATNDSATLSSTTGLSASSMSFNKIDDLVEGSVGGAIADVSIWYAYNITGATTPSITVTFTAGLIGGAICREYSGIQSSSDPLDKHTIANNGSVTQNAAPNSGATATLTGSNDLVVGAAGTGDSGNTYTAAGSFGNATTLKIGTTVDMGMEDLILSGSTAAQTATFTITNTDNWSCGVAAFKATGSTSAGPTFVSQQVIYFQ